MLAPQYLQLLKMGRLAEIAQGFAPWPLEQLDLSELKLLLACQLHRRAVGSLIESVGIDTALRICKCEPGALENWSVLLRMWLDAPAAQVLGSSSLRTIVGIHQSLDPGNAESLYALGMLEQGLGNQQQAAEAYLRVLERVPTHAAAQFRLWTMGIARTPELESTAVPDLSKETWSEGIHPATRGVLLRNVIDRKSLEDLLPEARQFCQTCYLERGQTPNFSWAPEHLKSSLWDIIRGQVLARVHRHVSPFAARGCAAIVHDQWHVQLQDPQPRAPTGLHSDHPVNSQQNDWTTFWIPLTPAGRGIAPSLRLLTVPFDQGLIPVKWNAGVMNEVRDEQIAEFFADHFRDITVDVGDVLAFGRFVQHETFSDPTMKNERVSCDVRFCTGPAAFGNSLVPAADGAQASGAGSGSAAA